MNTDAISGAAFGGASNPTGAANEGDLGKDEFLKLLTAQLANQDPLDPMDNTAFVSQMAEFSGLEQLLGISAGLEKLAVAQAVANGSNMVGFIGKTVAYHGNGFHHDGGETDLSVELSDPAAKVTVSVYDSEGELVDSFETGPMQEGRGTITWDGTDEHGQPVDPGDYTFAVSAENAEGQRVDVTSQLTGTVTGVTYENGYPELLVDGQPIAVGDVIEVVDGHAHKGETEELRGDAEIETSSNSETVDFVAAAP